MLSEDGDEIMTVGELRALIESSGLPDDAPAFVGNGMNQLAMGKVAHIVIAGGCFFECRSKTSQAELAKKEAARRPEEPVHAFAGLMLYGKDEAEDCDFDDDGADQEDK